MVNSVPRNSERQTSSSEAHVPPKMDTPPESAGPVLKQEPLSPGSSDVAQMPDSLDAPVPKPTTPEVSYSDEDNVPKKKNSRRKHRNSHFGCVTCKKRRIKCDEMLPQCFNCGKGKLHCAYLNLDARARSTLRMTQIKRKSCLEPLDEAMALYYKECHPDHSQHTNQQHTLPIPPVVMHLGTPQMLDSALRPAGYVEQPTDYIPAGYVPYQLVPQVFNNTANAGTTSVPGMLLSMYRPMVYTQQPEHGSAQPTVVYQQIPVQMVSTAQMPHMMYQSQDNIPIHVAHNGAQMPTAPVSAMDGQPIMIVNSHSDNNVPYKRSSIASANRSASTLLAITGMQLSQTVVQLPHLHTPEMAPITMLPGTAQGPMMHQIMSGAPYHCVGSVPGHQMPQPMHQITSTPSMSLIPGSQQMMQHPDMPGMAISPMLKPILSSVGALYYATPMLLAAAVSSSMVSASEMVKQEPGVFVKSEFSSELEKYAVTQLGKQYGADSPEPLSEPEKAASIKMLLS